MAFTVNQYLEKGHQQEHSRRCENRVLEFFVQVCCFVGRHLARERRNEVFKSGYQRDARKGEAHCQRHDNQQERQQPRDCHPGQARHLQTEIPPRFFPNQFLRKERRRRGREHVEHRHNRESDRFHCPPKAKKPKPRVHARP